MKIVQFESQCSLDGIFFIVRWLPPHGGTLTHMRLFDGSEFDSNALVDFYFIR